VNPSQFVQAREAGDRMGLERARLGQEGSLESARISQAGQEHAASLAQSAAQFAQNLAQSKAELEAKQKQTMAENQMAEEQMKQNFLREQTTTALTNAYRQAQIGIEKGRLDQENQKTQAALKQAASVLADRKQYALAIANGLPTAQAMAMFPGAWTPGIGAEISKEKTPHKSPTVSLSLLPKTEGEAESRVSGLTPEQAMKMMGTNAPPGLRSLIPPPAPAVAPSTQGVPKQGDVMNGYIFQGGDPSQQDNWQEAPTQPAPTQ